MPRVKRGPKRKNRRAKILKLAKGYWGMKSRGHRIAKEQVNRGLTFAFAGRKDRKGDFRKLWIQRINAATRQHGMSYSRFIAGLKTANIALNRKMLSQIAIEDPKTFDKIVEIAKKAMPMAQAA